MRAAAWYHAPDMPPRYRLVCLCSFGLSVAPFGCGDDTGSGGSGAGGSTWSGGNGGVPSGGAGAAPRGGGGASSGGGGAGNGGAPDGGAGGEGGASDGGGGASNGGGGASNGGGGASNGGGGASNGGGGGGVLVGGAGGEGGEGGDGGGGAPPQPWRFTATIDGNTSEWPSEAHLTTSAGSDAWVAWDDNNLYLAATHPDVGTGGSQHWLLAYIGNGSAGSTDGVAHGLQQPTLEFQANFLIRWKLDDSYSSLETWNGASWTSASPLFDSGGAVRSESGNTVELSVPLTTLAVTSQLDLAMTLLYEGAGFESTYGASPAGAITEGAFDPSIALYWPFDRASALAPSGYSPAP